MNNLIINKLKEYNHICLIDIGYHKGHFTQYFLQEINHLSRQNFNIIGVDPINYNVPYCNKFYCNAVSEIAGSQKFNIYDEPGCNSLLDMKLQDRVSDVKDVGWYCAYTINKVGEKIVEVIRLESILSEALETEPFIHFLKVDTQGNDINVIKSGKNLIDKVLFIQLETCVAKNQQQLMYDGQSTINDDMRYMESIGFDLIYSKDYSSDAPPEANLIFINKDFQ